MGEIARQHDNVGVTTNTRLTYIVVSHGRLREQIQA